MNSEPKCQYYEKFIVNFSFLVLTSVMYLFWKDLLLSKKIHSLTYMKGDKPWMKILEKSSLIL